MRIRLERSRPSREDIASGRSRPGYDGHLHIDCVLHTASRRWRPKKGTGSDLSEVSGLLELFATQKTGQVCTEGVFRISKDSLPDRGVIDLMLKVSTKVGRAKLNLVGATFDISNRSPYRILGWRPKPGSKKDLEIRIVIFSSLEQTTGNLEALSQILWNGMQEMVFEATPHSGAEA